MSASSSDYSEWNADTKWSSQVWESDEVPVGSHNTQTDLL